MKIHLVLPANNDHASLLAANHSDLVHSFCFSACLKNTAWEQAQGRLRGIVGAVRSCIIFSCTMSGFIADMRPLLGKEMLDSRN